MRNNFKLNGYVLQYHETPTIITTKDETPEDPKLKVVASKFSVFEVRCLLNRAEAKKKHGVMKPMIIAGQDGNDFRSAILLVIVLCLIFSTSIEF